MLSTSADRRRVVVLWYARLVIVVLLLSLSIPLSFTPLVLFTVPLFSVSLFRLLTRISTSAHTEGLDLDQRPPLLASGQNREAVSFPRVRCSFFHRNRSFHARAGSSYRDSASSPLLPSFFSLCLSSLLPFRPIEERAGHKSGATPARDCNPTGYTMLNRVPCASVCVYYMRVFRSRPTRSTPWNDIATISGAIDRSFYAY